MKRLALRQGRRRRIFSTEVDDWFGPGRSLQLVLPARRSGQSAAGAETGHDSEGDARRVWCDAALHRIALETGMHSPWVSRILTELA